MLGGGMDVLAARVAARYKSYKYDKAKTRQILKSYADPKTILDSKQFHGGYEVARLEFVPIKDIAVPKVWSEVKAQRVREDIANNKPLMPVHLYQRGSKWEIGDGIHRTNVSRELGYTHVPAIIVEWVETPEEKVPEPPEKPQLALGAWVKLNKPEGGRVYGWVAEVLGDRHWRDVIRKMYNIALVKPGDDWPDYVDMMDTSFEPVPAPVWGPGVKALVETSK